MLNTPLVPLAALLVEDQPDDAELLLRELRRMGYDPRARRVDSEADFLAALAAGFAPGQPWQIVLSDYRMPGFSGPRALELLLAHWPDIPFILISGAVGEEKAVAVIQSGAADYLVKGRLARLPHAIRRALEENRLRLEARAAEQARRASEQRFRALIEHSADGIGVVGADGRLSYLSPAIHAVLGYAPEALLGRDPFDFVHPDDLALVRAILREVLSAPGQPRETLYRLRHASGDWRAIRTTVTNLLAEPSVAGVVFNYRDITDQQADEQALRASEERYRGVFEGSPIALLEEDYSDVKRRLDALRAQGVADWPAYFEAHPAEVNECAALVKILASNASARQLYTGNFQSFIDAQVNAAFKGTLGRIAQGQTRFELEAVQRSASGQLIHLHLRWSALPGREQTLERVIVSAIDISERVRAEAELKRRLAELEAVNRVSVALRSARTEDEILARLVSEAIAAVGGAAGSVWLLDDSSAQVVIAHAQGWSMLSQPRPLGSGIPGSVVATGQPVLVADLKTDPRVPEDARAQAVPGRSGLCVPVRAAERIIGALYIHTDAPRLFAASDVGLLNTLAEIAGSALHRARLHAQTEQQLNRITALRSVEQAISSSLDLRVTLNVLLDQATTQLAADASDVLLFNPQRQVLEFAAGRGHRGGEAQRVRMRLGEGRAGRAAYDRRLVRVADLSAEPALDPAAAVVAAEGYVAYYGVPLLAKGQIKGVLEVYHRRRLDVGQDWLDFLEALADQAALAIDNASLFDSLQRGNLELTLAYDATLAGWARALVLTEPDGAGRLERQADQAVRLARALGVAEAELIHVRRGALLRDVGHMGLPPGLLLKPGLLTAGEWALVRQHPAHANTLLASVQMLRPALEIAYNHHERWDGGGYSRGLRGETIPLVARVMAVVDVWGALLSDRPHRAAWPREQALAYLRQQAGQQFDPRVVEMFLQQIESEK